MLEEEILEIYVDGSVRNEKAGIVGIIKEINSKGEEFIRELFSKDIYNAKSSEAEILACVYALEEADRLGLVLGKERVIVYSDLRLLVEDYQTMAHWIGKSISAKGGKFVSDRGEWKKLAKQRERYFQKYRIRVEIKKVLAHRSNIYNNSVDNIAKTVARQPSYFYPKPTSMFAPRKPNRIPKRKDQLSEVMEVSGQQVVIKVYDYEYWEKQIWIYKYEFFSSQKHCWVYSEYKISSRLSLECGKKYLVKVNAAKNNPWIVEAKEFEV